MSNIVRKPRQRRFTKCSLLLKFAFLGFVVPIVVATSPAMPQTTTSVSPKASQSATPKPNPSAESKKSEESKAAEEKKKPEDEKKQGLPLEWVAAIAGSVAVAYLFVLWRYPRWLLLIPSNFKTPKIGPIPELSPSVIHFFQYRDRVLDAWVSDRIEKAREEFDRLPTVKERNIHISMPVMLDGEMMAGLTAKDLGKTCSKNNIRLLIGGKGGAGKTHLACLIAKWAMAEQEEKRLCKYLMLPVLIEEELEEPKDTSTNKSPFLNAITWQLKNLRDDEKPIPEELLKKLLEKRRVLVIVDHLSEMSEATRKAIRLKDANFPVNALIVTSRLEDENTIDKPYLRIDPVEVNRDRLRNFMSKYLEAKKKEDLFEDLQYSDYLGRLWQIVTDAREMTLLFAKLYVDLMIAFAEGKLSEDLPKNIPDLMLGYVDELKHNVKKDNLEDAITVQQSLKLIAWECVQQTFKPETADRQEVLTRLAALVGEGEAVKETAKQHLQYLEKSLFLIRREKRENHRLRVSLDPLAEYLAGLYLVEHYRNDEEAWRSFLAEAAEKPGTLEEIRGFLLALRECCLVKAAETKVPNFIAEELGRLAGLDLEALEQEQLNRRIRYLISDLSRPNADDRVRAVEALGFLGSAAKFAATPIVKLLEDKDSEVRSRASWALGELGNASELVLQGLLRRLTDEEDDYEVRADAIEALGTLGNASEPVLQGLLTQLTNQDDSNARLRAARALGELGNASESVLQGLLMRLTTAEDNSNVRYGATQALVKLNYVDEDVISVLEAACQNKGSWFQIIARILLDRITNPENSAED